MSWAPREPTMWPLAEASANGVGGAGEANRRAVHDSASTLAAVWAEAVRCLELEAASSTENGSRREADEKALIRAVIRCAARVTAPDEESCRRFYEQNRRRFRNPDIYEAAHILIAADAGSADAYGLAKAKAHALLAELRLYPARFSELARLHSDCPSGAEGGRLPRIVHGQATPAFERALASLAPGALCPAPVVTRQGFHIIRLDRRIDGGDLPYDTVAGRVAELAKGRAVAQYFAHLLSVAQIQGIELTDAPGPH